MSSIDGYVFTTYVTCIEKLNPITMFHMKDGNVLCHNIASSYYPLIEIF